MLGLHLWRRSALLSVLAGPRCTSFWPASSPPDDQHHRRQGRRLSNPADIAETILAERHARGEIYGRNDPGQDLPIIVTGSEGAAFGAVPSGGPASDVVVPAPSPGRIPDASGSELWSADMDR